MTLENTIFWWAKKTYVLENIGCNYQDHAGEWFPAFANHSYARVRDFNTGVVVVNLTTSIGFGFLNAFPDYDHNRLWLFGTPAERCHGNCGAWPGPGPRPLAPAKFPSCESIWSWSTSLPVPTHFETALAYTPKTKNSFHTYNQGVSRVRVPGPGMPEHGYVMISEGDTFFINNDKTGNLTAAGAGWTRPPQTRHPGGSGGVSMQVSHLDAATAPAAAPVAVPAARADVSSLQWAADDTDATKPGWYYSVTGGATVGLSRSRDLKKWEPYHIAMSEEAGQFRIAEGLNGFAADAVRKNWAKMALKENW